MNYFNFFSLYKRWSPTTKFLGFWLPLALFFLALFLGAQVLVQGHSGLGDNVAGNKIVNNFTANESKDKILFYHDAAGRFYTAEEKDYLELILNYSVALMDLGEYEESIKISEKAIQKDFSFFGVWINIGNAYFHLNRYDDALMAYEEAIKRNSDSKLAWGNKCIVLKKIAARQRLDDCLIELAKKSN